MASGQGAAAGRLRTGGGRTCGLGELNNVRIKYQKLLGTGSRGGAPSYYSKSKD